MKRKIQFLLVPAAVSVAFAGNLTVCSTGFATAGSSGCAVAAAIVSPSANNLTADGNWYTASNSSGTFLAQSFVTVNNAYPVQNVGPWLANDASSAWVTPGNSQGAIYANATYYFGQNFQVVSGQQSAAHIAGMWLADDYGAGIYLNGNAVAQAALPVFGGLGGPMVAFSVNNGGSGQAQFVAGNNNITFGVVNDSTNRNSLSGGSTPTGLRVFITAADTNAPEPGTIFLLGGGLAALVFLGRRRAQA